ncbi:MAG: TIGR02530 family flagellar biosynthesis protein [Lachnospiraceae bacterium]|jgi:flagellar operon protein|nr:TIGR02530 family flagellar biosynthesis protein [Lachnospiraceae bacterium]
MDIKNNFSSIEQITGQYLRKNTNVPINKTSGGMSFEEVLNLKKSTSELKFSKHADARLNERHINLTTEQLQRLNDGARKASEKGIGESLMIMDDLAFIVNIKNSTVVTAIDSKASEENIFTNIDGAVIV